MFKVCIYSKNRNLLAVGVRMVRNYILSIFLFFKCPFFKCLKLTKCSIWEDVQNATTTAPELWKNSENSVHKKRDFEHNPKYCNLSIFNEVRQNFQNLNNLLLPRFPPYSSCVQVFSCFLHIVYLANNSEDFLLHLTAKWISLLGLLMNKEIKSLVLYKT